MSNERKTLLAVGIIALLLGSYGAYTYFAVPPSGLVAGRYFDQLVIIAMENQDYSSVFGDGTGSSSAPYLASLLSEGATLPNYHGNSICGGGSENAYIQLISAQDWGCPGNGARDIGNISTQTLVDLFEGSGITWRAFCESSCGRDGDHFPWIDFVSITSNSERMSHIDTSASTTDLVNAIGQYDFLWFTPQDSHNMHDNSVSSGDNYLSGFVPNILSKPGFTSGRTALLLWWDEYNPAPFLIVGPTVKHGLIDNRNDVQEYTVTKMIEENWNTPSLTGNDASQPSLSTLFVTGPPPALSASFTFSPSTPVIGQIVTFTGTATGGTSPYTFSWTFGDSGTASGATVTHAYSTNTTFTVTLTVRDVVPNTVTVTHSITVSSTPPPPPPPGEQPLVLGWGGILATGSTHFDTGNPVSIVFPGEQASNTEVAFKIMKDRGYTGARVSLNDPAIAGGGYDTVAWHKTLALASFFGFTLIGDDHEYDINSQSQWLSFWSGILADTPQSTYPNVFWEARNEPLQPSVTDLETKFQAFVDLVRSSGDTRWIVLGCNDFCSPNGGSNWLDNFPVVTDSANHIFYDFHEYYFYQYHSSEWTISQAESFADFIASGIPDITQRYGRPVIMTEFGTDFGPCVIGCPPDVVTTGSVGYTPVTLAYVNRLVQDLHFMGIGYTLWTAGDWTDTPGAGATGGLDIWGQLIELPSGTPPPPPATLTVTVNYSPTSPFVGDLVTFTATVSGGVSPYTVVWTFGDGASGIGLTVTHAYDTAGVFPVTATVTDSQPVSASASASVTVSPIPPPPPSPLKADFTWSPQPVRVGQTITFTATITGGTGPYTIQWAFGDSSSGTGNPITHVFTVRHRTCVALAVTDSVGTTVLVQHCFQVRRAL